MRPPAWPANVREAFFPDARAMLVGPRPDYARLVGNAADAAAPNTGDPAAPRTQPPSAKWSEWIDAHTLETEIKRVAQGVAASVTAPGPFKGGEFQNARRQFSLLAVLFAVSGEYDASARWQDVAPNLRDSFARAARNAKVGSDQTYNEAVARKQDLESLIRGERPQFVAAERQAKWEEVSDRPPLMQRLNVAQQERLAKWLANEREFAANREEIRHEAQIVVMLAAVIGREGFEHSQDPDYTGYALLLRDAAKDIATAADGEDFMQARQALDRTTKACADCHEGYRG
jgi:hypothetical protein